MKIREKLIKKRGEVIKDLTPENFAKQWEKIVENVKRY
jgi:hypothetical protein